MKLTPRDVLGLFLWFVLGAALIILVTIHYFRDSPEILVGAIFAELVIMFIGFVVMQFTMEPEKVKDDW